MRQPDGNVRGVQETFTPRLERTALRIQIDKHSNVGARPDGVARWVVSGGRGSEANADDFASYRLEIDHDYSGHGDRIRRVAFKDGQRFEFLPDAEFDENVELVTQHEDLDAAEAIGSLNEQQNRWPYSAASTLGFRPDYFAEMETQWRAAQAFIDFAVTA